MHASHDLAEEERDSARTEETEGDGEDAQKPDSITPEPSVDQGRGHSFLAYFTCIIRGF